MCGGTLSGHRSHWRGSPYESALKKGVFACFRAVGNCSEDVPRLPLPDGVPHFRGYGFVDPPALFGVWQLVGFETVTAPVSGFSRGPAVAFSPVTRSHLTGYTGCREEIPLIGS